MSTPLELSQEDYLNALKEAECALNKKEDGYMCITFSSWDKYVVPHSKGLKILEALEGCELLSENYQKPPEFQDASKKTTATFLTHKGYLNYKAAQLLQVPLEKLEEVMNDPIPF